ncbi:MAG: twin-arginine translocase TatA/TatE family subunit [Sulfurospirillaceae bacterium]|nr:twin-arginine translocase TatA/TatE family subunit [Sulfurospirillaceae bacterium]
MGVPSMPELLIILAIVVLLFGAKKIPDLAKGIGTGIKNFKKAVKEDEQAESEKIEGKSENVAQTTKVEEKQEVKG